MAVAYLPSTQRSRARPEIMRRVGSFTLSNVPATMFFLSRRISFAYRLASASVGNISVCLAGVLGAPSRSFFGTTDETNQRLGTVSSPLPIIRSYGLTLKQAPRQHNNHGKDEGRVRDERWRQPARESCGAAHDNHPTKAGTKSELVAEPRRATQYKFMLAASFGDPIPARIGFSGVDRPSTKESPCLTRSTMRTTKWTRF